MLMLMAAAFAGGVLNALAGGGTLITFPALIFMGMDSRLANATSTLALWPGTLGAVWGYRRYLAGARDYLKWLSLPSLIGGFAGAVLLEHTPSPLFDRLVPWLILFATVLFMIGEPLRQRLTGGAVGGERGTLAWIVMLSFQFVVGVYGGYFGAGIGIMMLAALLLFGLDDLHMANGTKNVLGAMANGTALVGFALAKLIVWDTAIVMAVAAIAGGYCGALMAERLGRDMVRRVVIGIGLTITAVLAWRVS
jgi:uncharacterized membrane protein YfcA